MNLSATGAIEVLSALSNKRPARFKLALFVVAVLILSTLVSACGGVSVQVSPSSADQVSETTVEPTYDVKYAADPKVTQETIDDVGAQVSELDRIRPIALAQMQNIMGTRQKELLNTTLPADKSAYSDQDVLNQYSIDVYSATAQPRSPEGTADGVDMLRALIASPEHTQAFEILKPYVESPALVLSIYETGEHNNSLSKGDTFMSVLIEGRQAKFIHSSKIEQDGSLSEDAYTLFELVDGKDGEEIWVLSESFTKSDSLEYETSRLNRPS